MLHLHHRTKQLVVLAPEGCCAGLDNLAQAEGCIAAAQDRSSQVFGARATYFLVNGSSGGLHAAVGACCRPGTVLLTSRSCHSSVFNAAALAGASRMRLQALKRELVQKM